MKRRNENEQSPGRDGNGKRRATLRAKDFKVFRAAKKQTSEEETFRRVNQNRRGRGKNPVTLEYVW